MLKALNTAFVRPPVRLAAQLFSMLTTVRAFVLARILGGARTVAALTAADPSKSSAATSRHTTGIDCACYYTENVYVRSPIEGHFTYEGEEAFSRGEHAALVANLTDSMRTELIANLEAETQRRRSQPELAAARKARIASEYKPLHPELWTLDPDAWLHPDFVALVRSAKAALSAGSSTAAAMGATGAAAAAATAAACGERRRRDRSPEPVRSGFRAPTQLAEGVYTLPIFSRAFCTLLCEELAHFQASGLPCGQPNSMNRFGALLDELGFTPAFIDPLMLDWIRPLAAALPALAAVGGASLDLHRAFVVRYRMGEDEKLSAHFDNAEVTLNANLGIDFDAGELLFYGHKDSAGSAPIAAHEWSEQPVGHGVLHLGQHVHAALPITSGERVNLVVWMRSSARRRIAGCPMCGETRRLLPHASADPGTTSRL